MPDKSYTDKLRSHSYESRVDPLRDAVRRAVAAWHQEDEQEKNDLSEEFWRAMADLEVTLRSAKRGGEEGGEEEDVPEVEVTSTRAPVHVEAPERPPQARRSAAKNVSDPKYQNAFISEARASMGQPSLKDAETFLGEVVVLTFNVDMTPRTGVLSDVVEHPANPNGPVYLILNDDTSSPFPLNSIQSIKLSDA